MDRELKSALQNDFYNYIEFRKSLSRSTRATTTYIRNLDRYICENYPDETELTEPIVMGWLNPNANESTSTLNARASFIRVLATHLCSIGKNAYIIPQFFCSSHPHPLPYLFTNDELRQLFHSIDADKEIPTFQGCILSTLLRMIYTCGLRPGEGLRILRENVNLTTGEILLVRTKNHKERLVIMSEDMLELACRYARIRDIAYSDSMYFFPSPTGKAYSTDWLAANFRRYFFQIHSEDDPAEMPHARVYDLRHLFASQRLVRWLNEGVDLNVKLPYLRTYMGHGSMEETEYYIHILPESLTSSKAVDFDSMEMIIPEVNDD